jgi:hypothetical protein
MTATEKAEELVNKMLDKSYDNNDNGLTFKRILHARAIRCALKVVDEIIEEIVNYADTDYLTLRVFYWKQVKEEIQKIKT